jgi:CRP-like cAMP-binding protein
MFRHHRSATALLEHRLGCSETLSTAQREALATLPIRIVELAARHDIVHEMDPSVQSCLIIEGMAHSSKMDFEGKRQIIALHLPGDLPDLHSFYLSNIDSTISTMTACRIGIIRREHFEELAADPFFAKAFARSVARDASVAREWILNLGQRDCVVRMAHLLSEIRVRLGQAGLSAGDHAEWQMSQIDLADALGMSTVHANRCVRQLARDGMIEWGTGTIRIIEPVALAEIGRFDDSYLQLHLRVDHPVGRPHA